MPTILVVEGEQHVRKMVAKALEREGFSVLSADSGSQAISLSRSLASPVDLLVSDVEMPDMDGSTLALELRRSAPDLPVLLMSGGCDPLSHVVASPSRFLFKPFSAGALAGMACSLLGSTQRAAH